MSENDDDWVRTGSNKGGGLDTGYPGSYTAAASQAREVTEKSVETFKQGVEKLTEQANAVAKIPAIDLALPMAQYFDYLQQVIDVNRDLANRWADLLTSLSDSFREQSERITGVVK